MSETKHTPGPWKWVNGYHDAYSIVTMDENVKIAGISFYQNTKKDRLHDANLIAAAPELLAGIKEIIDSINRNPVYPIPPWLMISIGNALIAYEKAGGEMPK